MEFITDQINNLDGTAVVVAIIIAIVISIITQLIKKFNDKDTLSTELIQSITLLLGVSFGVGSALLLQGDWVTYVLVGLVASYASNGIYDQLSTLMRLGK